MTNIIVLEAAFDDNDIQTDYFNTGRLAEWFVDTYKSTRVTDRQLRLALPKLPSWLRALEWGYIKPEKYSMSDHYYGELRALTDIGIRNHSQRNVKIEMRLRTTTLSIFKMNNDPNSIVPQTKDGIERLIRLKGRCPVILVNSK